MKKLTFTLAILISSVGFAKTYDVTVGDKVSIVVSKVSGDDEDSFRRSTGALEANCQKTKGQLIGPQKHLFKSYYRSKNWLGLQVCKGESGVVQIDNNSQRIVLMTVESSGDEEKASSRIAERLSEKCDEIDGELSGKGHQLFKDNYRATKWIGAQICKF